MSNTGIWVLAYAANALWQAPLLALAGWLCAQSLRWAGPRVEHRVWLVTLAAQVLLPASPLAVLPGVRAAIALLWSGTASAGSVIAVSGTVRALPGSTWNATALQACLVVYSVVVAFCLARFLRRMAGVRALRYTVRSLRLRAEDAVHWQTCTDAFHLPPVLVGESDAVRAPMTVGWRSIVLLLPQGMLETSAPGQVFAALAHEAAHIHRQDFAKNLLYEAAMLPLAWHPALWFVRERLVESREMICDAMAAEVAGGRACYAESLLRLALLLVNGRPTMVPHAIGIFDAHTLERRIEMLTVERKRIGHLRRVATAALCTAVGAVACGSAMALRVEPQPNAPGQGSMQSTASRRPLRVSSDVAAGQVLTKVPPKYPLEAKKDKVQGAVVLKAVIGGDGAMQKLTVISGPKQLQQSALDAVKQWVYKPYLLNGDPVPVETTITVNYSLAP